MNKKLEDFKEMVMARVFIVGAIIVLIGVIFAFIGVVYDDNKSLSLCKENGYDRGTFSGIEPGYVKCYSRIYVDHIKTENSTILEYSSWFRGSVSNE